MIGKNSIKNQKTQSQTHQLDLNLHSEMLYSYNHNCYK